MIEDVLRATVRAVLENADAYEGWTLQGLGMLRLRFDHRHRLHVWSHAHRVKDVTAIHDHPWNLISNVISGEIENVLYEATDDGRGVDYIEQEIVCGPRGSKMGESIPLKLVKRDQVPYLAGQSYEQRWYEIHESRPSDGAVSLIETWSPDYRSAGETARVFFKPGAYWVSAEPRPATQAEVMAITRKALDVWS